MPDDPSPKSSSPADSFDQRTRFGSFEILRTEEGKQFLLGKGAFGRTYKARHVFLERTVALKIINDKFLTDAKARESLYRGPASCLQLHIQRRANHTQSRGDPSPG